MQAWQFALNHRKSARLTFMKIKQRLFRRPGPRPAFGIFLQKNPEEPDFDADLYFFTIGFLQRLRPRYTLVHGVDDRVTKAVFFQSGHRGDGGAGGGADHIFELRGMFV